MKYCFAVIARSSGALKGPHDSQKKARYLAGKAKQGATVFIWTVLAYGAIRAEVGLRYPCPAYEKNAIRMAVPERSLHESSQAFL